LFLVGGTGGLLSRLSRSLDRKDVPTDYGASWTTLFLSPVVGALGAWAGILLIGLAHSLNVLGSALAANWNNPHDPMTLAVALLFGFSERLLSSIFGELENKAGVKSSDGSTSQQDFGNKNASASSAATKGAKTSSVQQSELRIVTSAVLPKAEVGRDYRVQLQTSGGSGNPVWKLQDGESLPDGLTLETEGLIAGKPVTARDCAFVLEVSDSTAKQTQQFTITITL